MANRRFARTATLWSAGLLAMAAIGVAAARAGAIPRVEIVAFGTYTSTAEHGPLPARYRQHAIVDVTVTGMPRLVERSDRIEARACTRFGLQYRSADLAPDQSIVAEVRVDHPILVRPDGRRSDVDTYEIPVRSTIGWTGLDFDEGWEMVPGTWTFSLLFGGHVLAEQRFTVVAAPGGAAPTACVHPMA